MIAVEPLASWSTKHRSVCDRTGPQPAGTQWVHAEPAGSGVQRAPAVTTGAKEPQVRLPTPPPPGTTSGGGPEFESPHLHHQEQVSDLLLCSEGLLKPRDRAQLLAAVSAAQLASGVAGMVVALRRRHPYDVFWMHGRPDEIARDTLFKGTALSAPVSNLLTHAAMTAVVARRPGRRAEQALGGLGALLVAGYLGERLVRQRLRPSGWDRLESPLLVVAIGLAAAMARLGLGDPVGRRLRR